MPTVHADSSSRSPFDHANDGEVLVAYEMNGKPLPMLNGFPLRLIVPGWFATYWVKALNEITVLTEPFHGFWMDKAYRVPKNPEMQESPKDLAKETVPISTMPVRSLVRPPRAGRAQCRPAATRTKWRRRVRRGQAESRRSRSRPTAAGRGRRRSSGRTWANTRGAAGGSTGSRRARAADAHGAGHEQRRRDAAGRPAVEPQRVRAERDRVGGVWSSG